MMTKPKGCLAKLGAITVVVFVCIGLFDGYLRSQPRCWSCWSKADMTYVGVDERAPNNPLRLFCNKSGEYASCSKCHRLWNVFTPWIGADGSLFQPKID